MERRRMSETALIILGCVLMCPLMMALMMLFMRKSHGDSHGEHAHPRSGTRNERTD
jgi:hypothetical protein